MGYAHTECSKCNKPIRFIRRSGEKTLVVEASPVYYLPEKEGPDTVYDDSGRQHYTKIVADGCRGWKPHRCS